MEPYFCRVSQWLTHGRIFGVFKLNIVNVIINPNKLSYLVLEVLCNRNGVL